MKQFIYGAKMYNPRKQGRKDALANKPSHKHNSPWNQAQYDEGYEEGSNERAELEASKPHISVSAVLGAERYQKVRRGHPRLEVRYWTGQWWEPLSAEKLDAVLDGLEQAPNASNERPASAGPLD